MALSPDPCPGIDDIHFELLASLPRGRAWRTRQGLPEPGTGLWEFWRAVSSVFAVLEARLCALRQEFFCDTASETYAAWLREYGLPDVCDVYPDLCTKVAAAGGQTIAYFAALAARIGWSVSIANTGASEITVTINTAASPSYVAPAPTTTVSRANRFRASQKLSCAGQNTTPVSCLLARVLPAHLHVIYAEV